MDKEYYKDYDDCDDVGFSNEDDDEKYMLTPWGCLYGVLIDYGVNVSHISGRVGEHIVDDFMDAMVKCGYVGKVEDNDIQGE